MSNKNHLHYRDVKLNRVTVTGLVDSIGRFWGENEHGYRYYECTHVDCTICGSASEKHKHICDSCGDKIDFESWENSERRPLDSQWDCVYSDLLDEYLYSWDDVMTRCEEHDLNPGSMLLYHCKERPAPYVDLIDLYENITPEGTPIESMWNKDIEDAVDRLNSLMALISTRSFIPTNIAVDFDVVT